MRQRGPAKSLPPVRAGSHCSRARPTLAGSGTYTLTYHSPARCRAALRGTSYAMPISNPPETVSQARNRRTPKQKSHIAFELDYACAARVHRAAQPRPARAAAELGLKAETSRSDEHLSFAISSEFRGGLGCLKWGRADRHGRAVPIMLSARALCEMPCRGARLLSEISEPPWMARSDALRVPTTKTK